MEGKPEHSSALLGNKEQSESLREFFGLARPVNDCTHSIIQISGGSLMSGERETAKRLMRLAGQTNILFFYCSIRAQSGINAQGVCIFCQDTAPCFSQMHNKGLQGQTTSQILVIGIHVLICNTR